MVFEVIADIGFLVKVRIQDLEKKDTSGFGTQSLRLQGQSKYFSQVFDRGINSPFGVTCKPLKGILLQALAALLHIENMVLGFDCLLARLEGKERL